MNNNRNQNNNNNRRRGRGNRNQGGGGGSQGNRIDSRARGNAPQLLDKYKKLAEDAHRNGDRVQAEYYLQFADHYFRVIADNRTRQDEQRGDRGDQRLDVRGGRRDERDQDDLEGDDEMDGDRRFDSREREPRDTRDREPREARREPRNDTRGETRADRPRREPRRDEQVDIRSEDDRIVEGAEGPAFEPEDNPFVREGREPRDSREERPRRRAPRARREENESTGIDAAALPPAFLANDATVAEASDEPATPRPRRKRSDGGTLSAVG